MITEQDARAAAKQVPAIALVDMSPPVREVVMWATCELARREWQDDPDGDGWYWCENLGADSPPQLFRTYQPLKFNPEDSTFSVDMSAPRKHQRWTVSGWVEPIGRVCKITERPA